MIFPYTAPKETLTTITTRGPVMFSRCPISTYCTYRGRLCVIVVVCTARGKRRNIALTARTGRGIGIAVITIAIVTQCG